MRVILNNQEIHVAEGDLRLMQRIAQKLSYASEGAMFSDAYRNGRWDGRVKLFRFSKRTHTWSAPAGLADEVINGLGGLKFEFSDKRRGVSNKVKFKFRVTPFEHQTRAIEATIMPRGPFHIRARGIIRMAIRGGKTVTSGGVIAELGHPTLFLVESKSLLRQAAESLSDCLGVKAGIIGDGIWQPGKELTVAMVQSLVRKKGGQRKIRGSDNEYETVEVDPRLKELFDSIGVLVFDECHHLDGVTYRAIMTAVDCPYKIGLTATLNNAPKDIHLHGATGPILCEVGASELISVGRLLAPDVRLVRYELRTAPGVRAISKYRAWSSALRKQLIDENDDRNRLIGKLVKALLKEVKSVLVHVVHLEHAERVIKDIEKIAKIKPMKVIGSTSTSARNKAIAGLNNGSIRCVVSNLLTEGVDIPGLEACINAAGGADKKQTMQRMRCLTTDPKRPNKQAIYVDITDVSHNVTGTHAHLRLSVYRSEPKFNIRSWRV